MSKVMPPRAGSPRKGRLTFPSPCRDIRSPYRGRAIRAHPTPAAEQSPHLNRPCRTPSYLHPALPPAAVENALRRSISEEEADDDKSRRVVRKWTSEEDELMMQLVSGTD